MAKKEQLIEPEIWVEIRCGRKLEQFRSWRYYSIVDALRTMGVGQNSAYELGRWAIRAQDGDSRTEQTENGTEVQLRAVLR